MAIWNLGSINVDLFYDLSHLPSRGETLSATGHRRGLGGKGANLSVAAARAAATVHHIGAVGPDGVWTTERLLEYGVDSRFVETVSEPTGHAIIAVDTKGENQIVIFSGANGVISHDGIGTALSQAETPDWFVTQNETNAQPYAAKMAKSLGLSVAYVAAPFEVAAVSKILPDIDLLILNEIEAAQLEAELSRRPADLGVSDVIVTLGEKGCTWFGRGGAQDFQALNVNPVDTTGAGDTFAGYVLAGLDRGLSMHQSIEFAQIAAALMVTRHGTADVIPDLKEVLDYRAG